MLTQKESNRCLYVEFVEFESGLMAECCLCLHGHVTRSYISGLIICNYIIISCYCSSRHYIKQREDDGRRACFQTIRI